MKQREQTRLWRDGSLEQARRLHETRRRDEDKEPCEPPVVRLAKPAHPPALSLTPGRHLFHIEWLQNHLLPLMSGSAPLVPPPPSGRGPQQRSEQSARDLTGDRARHRRLENLLERTGRLLGRAWCGARGNG